MEQGVIIAVSIGDRRGRGKKPVKEIYLEEDHGALGDVHAGPGPRQVALLEWERLREAGEAGLAAGPGDFAENLLIKDLDFSTLEPGTVLKAGEATLAITGRGKPEWRPGDYSFQGEPLAARYGLFARVVESGTARPGDPVAVIG